MRVDEIIRYSKDYKELLPSVSASFFTVRIDFDFALSLPDMENRVYYRKDCYQRTKDNLNSHGIFLIFDYLIPTMEITDITVVFDKFCQVPYRDESDISQIVTLLHEYKA